MGISCICMEQKDILYTQAVNAKNAYKYGIITREEALEKIQPFIDFVNKTSIRLAKEYNAKPRLVDAVSFLR